MPPIRINEFNRLLQWVRSHPGQKAEQEKTCLKSTKNIVGQERPTDQLGKLSLSSNTVVSCFNKPKIRGYKAALSHRFECKMSLNAFKPTLGHKTVTSCLLGTH